MKRFYREADTEAADWGWAVRLDGKPVKTPAKRPLIVPTAALAETIAAEWAAQGETVEPASMRVSRLATTAVDLMPERRSGAVEQVAEYAATDLLCYRAAYPQALVDAQARHWDPPLAWLAEAHGVRLAVAAGMMPVGQDEAGLRAIAAVVAREPDWPLVGLHALTTTTGSVVLALMVRAGALTGEAAADAALVDERFERAQWGEEADARGREDRLIAEVAAAERFLAALAA